MRVPAVPYLPTSQPLPKRYRFLFSRVLTDEVMTLSMLALLRNEFAAAYMVRGCGHRITRGLRCLHHLRYVLPPFYGSEDNAFIVGCELPPTADQ
jgi:hypothetical protein